MAVRQDSPQTGSAEDLEEEEEEEEVGEEEDADEDPEPEVTQPSEGEEEDPDLNLEGEDTDLLAASLAEERGEEAIEGRGMEDLSEDLQQALRVAHGATREGEPGRVALESLVGWSAAEAVPSLVELTFGAPARARQQQAFLKDWDPKGLTEGQERAFAAEEAAAGAKSREFLLRQQAFEASKGQQLSASTLKRTREAYRKELQEASTRIGMTRAITDIALENQQEAQRQTDLDQLAQFSTQYYRNLIGTPLGEVVKSAAEFRANQIAFRAQPDVESSIEELRRLGVPDDDIAVMMSLVEDMGPDERKAYLASVTTAYEDVIGRADLPPGAEVPGPETPSPAEEALLERTSTTPEGSGWLLPNDGVNVYGPFGLEGDDDFQYYWDQNGGRYIAFVEGQEDPIVIRKDNMVANNRLEPAFRAYQASLQQGQ